MDNRERLGSRLGFILLSAGCAIGCGNVWKFPWMCGQYGGGGFVLIYIICLLILGLPCLVIEFALGRASQVSPLFMYHKLEKPGSKWHLHGYICLPANFFLMAFYTVVAGWFLYYFVMFLGGQNANLGFVPMITNPKVNVASMFAAVFSAFLILSFNIQKGLERVSKYMMCLLMLLMLILACRSLMLPGVSEGLHFYMIPDFSKINASVIAGAMNQAFFTISIGIGSMAIFGSYINKDRALLGESVNVIILDTLVAIVAGLIIFPACYTYGVEVNAGPSLLFDTMVTVFNNMAGGRWWGTLFFLFMVFAALSTVLAVCENILAMVRELTGWSRPVGCLICGLIVFTMALTTALGFSVLHFEPFAAGSTWLDFWDFLVSNNLLPLGSLAMVLFCTTKAGWGWDNLLAEVNEGVGIKFPTQLKPLVKYCIPVLIIIIYISGMVNFPWK